MVRVDEREQQWQREQAIPEFERQNPGIKINLVPVVWADYDNKMQAMIAAGVAPDIFSLWGASSFGDYNARGWVANLTPYIQQDLVDLSDFLPGTVETYTLDGRIMGMPFQTGGSYVFYNKALLDAAGLIHPPVDWSDPDWTWQAFVDQCAKLTRLQNETASGGFGCSLDFWPYDQYAWLWGHGIYPESSHPSGYAEKSNLDDPLAITAFQSVQDLIWESQVIPNPAGKINPDEGDLFRAQKVAMRLTGVWGWRLYADLAEFDWGVAALPAGADGRRDVLFTDAWLMSSKTTHPQETWTFLKYLSSAEVQAQWMGITYAPPVRSSLVHRWAALFSGMQSGEVEQVFLGSLDYGVESPSHMLVGFTRLNHIVTEDIDQIFNNRQSAEEVLPTTDAEVEQELAEIRSEQEELDH